MYASYGAAQTAEGNWYAGQGGYANAAEMTSYGTANVECDWAALDARYTTGLTSGGIAFCGPTVANAGVTTNNNQTPPPVIATATDIVTKITSDLTAGSALGLAAADEAEDILNKGLPAAWNPSAVVSTPKVTDQTSAPPTDGAVVDTTIPATPTTGATTPAGEAINNVPSLLPATGAINSSNTPAAGSSSSTTPDTTYNDPSYWGIVYGGTLGHSDGFRDPVEHLRVELTEHGAVRPVGVRVRQRGVRGVEYLYVPCRCLRKPYV